MTRADRFAELIPSTRTPVSPNMQEMKRRRRRSRNSPSNPFEWILFGFLRDPLIVTAEHPSQGRPCLSEGERICRCSVYSIDLDG